VYNQYPAVRQFSTEHSGGTWVGNQHNEDLADIVNYARNRSGSLVKWSLALNQFMGRTTAAAEPAPGSSRCRRAARAGQIDYTIEYYTTGPAGASTSPPRRARQQPGQRDGYADLGLHRRCQPEVDGARLSRDAGRDGRRVVIR
jgi:hypothetical protein